VADNGMVDGVIYYDADGVERRQKAHVVVLACNGIGTPRTLLHSRSKNLPDGLANRSGLVGKNLMFDPFAMIGGMFEEPLEQYRGPQGCGVSSHEFYETDRQHDFVRGYSHEIARGWGRLPIAMWGLQSGRIPWGADHHRACGEPFDHTAGMTSICEDLPEPRNCVTLDPDLRDSHGIPAPKVTYRLRENSINMLEHSVARGREVMDAAGARELISIAPWPDAGWHLMGTARMGRDPRTSVVNEWGRSHDVHNLFIIDGRGRASRGGTECHKCGGAPLGRQGGCAGGHRWGRL